VARLAQRTGAKLIVNTDTHTPADMIDQAQARLVALGAGLSEEKAHAVLVEHPWALVAKALSPSSQTV
jgi:histidinol phosphatase-like PHP family hydrolase